LLGALQGAAVGIALPRLDCMLNQHGDAWAAGGELPRRFGTWAIANGVHLDRWVPEATGPNYTLSSELMPLADIKDLFTVITGTNLPAIGENPGRGHSAANTILMTGVGMRGTGDHDYTAGGASIDQLAADLMPPTARRSIELAVTTGPGPEAGTAFHWWSHNGPNNPNVCNHDCLEVFETLFSAGLPAGPGASVGFTAKTRTSILDSVKADTNELLMSVGANDKHRVNQHLEGILAIERRLQAAAMNGEMIASGCHEPGAPLPTLVGSTADYDDNVRLINRTMSELLALALACDITRVFTYQVMQPGSRVNVNSFAGENADHHSLSHNSPGDERMHQVLLGLMSELAVFAEVLRETPDGAAQLIDSCAILAANDCNQGPTHGLTDYPLLVLGGAGGLAPGRHVRLEGVNALRVPLTLARAAGADVPNLGEATESIDELFG
jgi:hypothetical protein